MSYSSPFSVFAHLGRTKILKALTTSPHTVTELSEMIDLSMPEISRHLSKLMDHHFVTKSAVTRKYEATPFGLTALTLYRPLDFLLSNDSYFHMHMISDLEPSLQSQLHLLEGVERINGTGFVMLKMQELVEQTNQELLLMVDQPFPFGKGGIGAKYLVPESLITQNPELKPDKRLTSAEAKILPRLPVALAISDMETGLLHFRHIDGDLDYSSGFHCTSSDGLQFLLKIWNTYWSEGKTPEQIQSK